MSNSKESAYWRRWRVIWYFSGCVIVAVILIVGGLTRLNQAGLSITEWEVISGITPPLTESQWDDAFQTYRQFPEYQNIHRGMSLAEFKVIYLWEYTHRMLSRVLGVLFIIPFMIFIWKRAMPFDEALKLGGIALLGGLQAFLGWYMVQSGLADQPVVSHLRLGIHLVVAFLIFTFLWNMAVNRLPKAPGLAPAANSMVAGKHAWIKSFASTKGMHIIWIFAVVLLFIQVLVGGWTAGLKAGYVYPTFPKMGNYWIPPEIGFMSPWWFDFSHNSISVQFLHRMLALLVTLLVIPLSINGLRSEVRMVQISAIALLLIIAAQILTGVLNLLWGVPVWLSSVHQFGALVLLAALLTMRSYSTYFMWNYQPMTSSK